MAQVETSPMSAGFRDERTRAEGDVPVNFSRRPGRPSVRTKANDTVAGAQITPPLTPETRHEPEYEPIFHNYLRVLYSFDPAANVGGADVQVTASIEPGDLVLVHSVHANGWADGTVLTTGARGWLPTNYCEPFTHPHMLNLLNATTSFWDLLGTGAADDSLNAFVRQDYIRSLIAGVRYLLDRAGCLHRDAPLVQRHTGIRRMRKGLLADLSSLVSIARRLQEAISKAFAPEVIHALLEELVTKAFKVVTRAVGFLDMWTQEKLEAAQKSLPKPANLGTDAAPPTDSEQREDSARDSLETEHTGVAFSQAPSVSGSTAVGSSFNGDETDNPAGEDAQSQLRRSFSSNHAPKRASIRFRPKSGLIAQRVFVEAPSSETSSLASHQLAKTHDECISQIGAYIGLHLHSRPSAELVATTARLVEACEHMLRIVDLVTMQDSPPQAEAVQSARAQFQAQLDDLTRSTKDAFQPSDGDEHDILVLPDQSRHLVAVGTGLIRRAGECVAKTRAMIEQIGDFDLNETSEPTAPDTQMEPSEESKLPAEATPPPESVETEAASAPSLAMLPWHQRSASHKLLPPLPPPDLTPLRPRSTTGVTIITQPLPSPPLTVSATVTPITPLTSDLRKSLPLVPFPPKDETVSNTPIHIETIVIDEDAVKQPADSFMAEPASPSRKGSFGTSVSESTEARQTNARDSGITAVSEVSTRATTPDQSKRLSNAVDSALISSSVNSLTSLQSAAVTDAGSDTEAQLLQKTYADELTFTKDGSVCTGTLPALVEQLTSHDSLPDPQYWSAFFITFRTFTNPCELVATLTDRFDYVGDSPLTGAPVRLRICNVFKGWLETHWHAEQDRSALGEIRHFATHKVKPVLPTAGERLLELTRKISAGYQNGSLSAPLVSGMSRTSASQSRRPSRETVAPEPIATKSQLAALRNGPNHRNACSILDLDPLEVARQLTLLTLDSFTLIQPEELLNLEWTKKDSTIAVHVRQISALNTDLVHMVQDTILSPEDAKKRALMIKHWTKIAMHCLDLSNYESLTAITCALNHSVLGRLRRTWEQVSKKTKARLAQLNEVIDISHNRITLRSRLEHAAATGTPCLPFLGLFLTDLVFINEKANMRSFDLPKDATATSSPTESDVPSTPRVIINFDKHSRAARIVSMIQGFQQLPHVLRPVPEFQAWLDASLTRIRAAGSDTQMLAQFYERSQVVEPKMELSGAGASAVAGATSGIGAAAVGGGAVSGVLKRRPSLGLDVPGLLPRPSTSTSLRSADPVAGKFDFFSRGKAVKVEGTVVESLEEEKAEKEG